MNMQELKEGVIKYYQNNKRIKSPIFGIIKITPQTLWHLENKDKYHKRTEDQLKIRYKCFLLIDQIITKSYLYQEYKQETQEVLIKKHWKKQKILAKVKYYWLVGIIEAYQWHRIRIKVVLKKVANRNNYELVSVIPAWNMKWYHRLYFDENL